ncbi:MAG: hypothetical protein ACKOEV_00340 [Cytophagales bacterium]
MKWGIIILAIALPACTGRLSDEQKRKIKEEMESSQIKKISEAEITETAFAIGRAIALPLEKRDKQLKNHTIIDSLQRVYSVSIVALTQSDSLLYTKPMMQTRADGSEELVAVLGIRIPKREIVKKIRE